MCAEGGREGGGREAGRTTVGGKDTLRGKAGGYRG